MRVEADHFSPGSGRDAIRPRFCLVLALAITGALAGAPATSTKPSRPVSNGVVWADPASEGRVTERTFRPAGFATDLPFVVITPRDSTPKPWPVLFLLHGHGRNQRTLLERPQVLNELLAQEYLVVCPTTRNGWYVNSPAKPEFRFRDAMAELFDLVAREYPVTTRREGWAIAGWSMGGFGAVTHAADQPGRFGFVGSIIGLLDFPKEDGLPANQRYTVPRDIFGREAQVWNQFNPINLIERLRNTEVFLVLADESFDLTMNRNFIRAAEGKARVTVVEIHGGHTAASRDQGVRMVLREVQRFFKSAAMGRGPDPQKEGRP